MVAAENAAAIVAPAQQEHPVEVPVSKKKPGKGNGGGKTQKDGAPKAQRPSGQDKQAHGIEHAVAGNTRSSAARGAFRQAFDVLRESFRNDDVVHSNPDDTADLGLVAQLHRKEFDEKGVAFNSAVEISLQALDVARRGPDGIADLRTGIYMRCTCGFLVSIFLVVIMLISARGFTRVAVAHDGLLVVGGANAVRRGAMAPGEELVVSTAKVMERKSLPEVAALPVHLLRDVRDITFVHEGVWRCIHITRAQKLGYGQVLLEAADGTAVRVMEGRATIRFGHGGVEEPLETGEVIYTDESGLLPGRSTKVRPSSLVSVTTRWNP
jgi:hypothetical protein